MTTFQEPRKNWADTQEIRPRQIFHPTSIAEISQIIQDANADDRRVRAIGSLWSFTDVALSHDYLIELDQMNFVLSYSQSTSQGTVWWHGPSNLPDPALDQGTALTAIGGTTTQRLVHTLAGITIQDLYIALDSPETDTPNPLASGTRTRWALPTQGGSAGQTLAGAISTGTHGADFDLPPIPDIVRAIELIAPDGSLRWFDRSPDKGAIFDPNSFARVFAADPLAPVLLQDDDAFYAILVSMGCMGVITSLVIEVTDQFGLSQRVLETNWSTVKQLIQDGSIFGALPPWPGVTAFPAGDQAQHPETDIGQFGNPVEVTPRQRGVEVFLNPYRLSDDYSNDPAPDRRCLVVSHAWTRDAIDPPASSINPGLSWIEPAIILNTFLANPAGSFVRQAIDATMNSARGNSVGYPVAWSVYDGGGASQPVVSIEIAVINTNQGAAAFVDAILSAFDSIIATDQNAKLASFFTLRFTQTSSAFLAMQNFDATTEQAIPEGTRVCHVEIGCLQDLDPLGTRQIGMDTVGRPIFDQLISAGQEHLVAFETLAIEFDAHLHWGEYTYTNRQDPAQYGHFDIWLEQRNSLTNYGEFRAFDNDFTEKYGISSSHSLGWTNTQAAMLPESPGLFNALYNQRTVRVFGATHPTNRARRRRLPIPAR
jgi:hypothetical protein